MAARAELEALLTAAFAFADGATIDSHALVTNESWEDQELVASFSTISEGLVPDAVIERHRDSLASFSAVGFVAVLPHYLRYALAHPQSEVAEFVLYRLAAVDSLEPYWIERLAVIDERKRFAICEVLKDLEPRLDSDQREHASQAISFWCVKSRA